MRLRFALLPALLLTSLLALGTPRGLGAEAPVPSASGIPGDQSAADQSPPVDASAPDVETYGEADATCLEWSNDCQVCRRQPSGGRACSTPGIACLPETTTCRKRR